MNVLVAYDSESLDKGRRRLGSFALVLVLSLGMVSVLTLASPERASAETLNPWTISRSIPAGGDGAACVTALGYIYCLAGESDATYFAPLSSSGVGTWTRTTSYPTVIGGESCAEYDAYIYCVSGNDGTGPMPESAEYYAPLSSSGIGTWMETGSAGDYPDAIGLSCAAAAGYIYCVGGDGTVGTLQEDEVSYAPISSAGIGTWTLTTEYPISDSAQSCLTSGNHIYCIGGYTSNGPQAVNSTYYASISSSGVGAWTTTTTYPTTVYSQSCAVSSGVLYCMAGSAESDPTDAVYYSAISPSGGLGAWTSTASYPTADPGLSCVVSGGDIYCAGGEAANSTDAVYYTSPVAAKTAQLTVDSQNTNGQTITGYYTEISNNAGSTTGTGFTPVTFSVDEGQAYTVHVDGYASCTFSHWEDTGSADASRSIDLTGSESITAVYSCASAGSGVTVNSVDQDGSAISGYRVVLKQGSAIAASGFTTAIFPTTAGQTYTLEAESYGNCTFGSWSGLGTSGPVTFTATSQPVAYTAIYDCGSPAASRIDVSTVDGSGASLTGLYISLWQGGKQLQSCFSTCSFEVANGQTYQVEAASFGLEHFSHWKADHATGRETVSIPDETTLISLVAVYEP